MIFCRKDLLKSVGTRGSKAKPAVAWTIESRGFGSGSSLPSDINATVVDEHSDGATAGRLFVAGLSLVHFECRWFRDVIFQGSSERTGTSMPCLESEGGIAQR